MMAKIDEKSEEKLAFGRVFQNMRRAKGFTLDEAASETVSTGNISKFENGNLMVGTHVFFDILQNINVYPEEFFFEFNKYLPSKDILFYNTEISTAYMNRNASKLKAILKELDKTIENQENKKRYKLDRVRIEAAIYAIDPTFVVPETDISFLKNYLLGLKHWGRYDTLLLEYTTNLFDMVTLPILANKMIEPTNPLKAFPPTERATIQTLLNLIGSFIENDQVSNAEKYITYLEDSNIHDFYMSEKLMLVYHKAQLAYRKGEQAALDTMKRCVEMLEFCKCYGMANMLGGEVAEIEAKGS